MFRKVFEKTHRLLFNVSDYLHAAQIFTNINCQQLPATVFFIASGRWGKYPVGHDADFPGRFVPVLSLRCCYKSNFGSSYALPLPHI